MKVAYSTNNTVGNRPLPIKKLTDVYRPSL